LNENAGLRTPVSNLQVSFFDLKVRQNFHALTHFMTTGHFERKKRSADFHLLARIFRSGSGTNHGGSALIEP